MLPTPVNVTLMGKMCMQPILPVTVLIKKIKGAARQRYGDSDGVRWGEQAFTSDWSVNSFIMAVYEENV